MSDAAACCAEFYQRDIVRQVLGEHFHPGGRDLSRRLIGSLGLRRGWRVLDVASGLGVTALDMAANHNVQVVGLDFGPHNVASARSKAVLIGLADRARFVEGDARALPFADASFDAVICECAVSTFDDKELVAREMARVLRPGGTLGISDMAVEAELPEEIASVVAPWTCLGDALSAAGYQDLFRAAGFEVASSEDERRALADLVADLKRRLLVVGLGQASGILGELDISVEETRTVLARCAELVAAGDVSYVRQSFIRSAGGDPV